MTLNSMQESNQSAPWGWSLAAGDVRRVPALPVDRWLTVQAGRLWVTRDDAASGEAEDIWLEAGQELHLPPGSAWLVEAWPHAQARLIEAPPRRCSATTSGHATWARRPWSPLAAWRRGWAVRAAPHGTVLV